MFSSDQNSETASQRTVAFVANRGYALTSSRKSLITRFVRAGWQVLVVTAADAESRSLAEIGASLEAVAFRRGAMAFQDWFVYKRLKELYRFYRPSLIQQFHAKPIVLGTLAARAAGLSSTRICNTVTGLGAAFSSGSLASLLSTAAFRSACKRADVTVFQNPDDRELFLQRKICSENSTRVIISSGVDVERFAYTERNSSERKRITVIMLGRLLKTKGVYEFVQLADRIKRQRKYVDFVLAGEPDIGHRQAIPVSWVERQNSIEYRGRLHDVVPTLHEADIFLFPSTYREGVPRVLLEAAATGLPVIAFDVPGVREAVRHRQTGFLVPEGDLGDMEQKLTRLIDNAPERETLGRHGREMVLASFDVRQIEAQYMDVYASLGAGFAA